MLQVLENVKEVCFSPSIAEALLKYDADVDRSSKG